MAIPAGEERKEWKKYLKKDVESEDGKLRVTRIPGNFIPVS